MSLDSITFDLFDEVDSAIIRALRKHPQGIRYVELHKDAKVNGERINVKTYDKHLKWLVKESVVERNEISRAKVIYRLHPTEAEKGYREFQESWIYNKVVKNLIALFEHRREIDVHQAEDRFYEILYRGVFIPLSTNVVATITQSENPIELNLTKNAVMYFYEECVKETVRIIEQNDETRGFFKPLLSALSTRLSHEAGSIVAWVKKNK